MKDNRNSSVLTQLYIVLFNLCFALGKIAIKAVRVILRLAGMVFFAGSYSLRAVREMFEQWYEELMSKGKSERSSIGRSIVDFCTGTKSLASSSAKCFKGGAVAGIKSAFGNLGSFFALTWKSFAPMLNYAAPVFAIVVTAVIIANYSDYGYGLVVEFKGSEIGIIENETVFNNAVSDISQRVEEATGQQYTVSAKPRYTLVMMNNSGYASSEDITNKIVEKSPELFYEGYGLFVDGNLIAANGDEQVLQNALNSYLAPYSEDEANSEADISFVEEVEIREGLYLVTKNKTQSQIEAFLNAPMEEEATHTVAPGDTIERIADKYNMDLDELCALNEGVEDRYIIDGEELLIKAATSVLKVKITKTEIYEAETEIPVIEIKNDTIYEGTTKVITEGMAGIVRYTADVSVVDGTEVDRVILNEEVLKEATPKQVYVGTKERPKTAATGTWKRPIKGGRISSWYGWRTVFGSSNFHKGIDFAAPKGTEIYAADGGTVIFMGYNGNYGKLVKIDHGNGYVSLYGHCSAYADLKVGDKVYQGQLIAYVGSTGRSTGPHVHLEIRYDNEPININKYYD